MNRKTTKAKLRNCRSGTGKVAEEIEFSDDQGRTYAVAALRAEKLIVLHYLPAKAG
jgi:hypothetical protein